mgnify:FL=1
MTIRSTRAAAARTIHRVLSGESLNHFFHDTLLQLDENRRPLCQELVYGTLREWPYLVAVSEHYLDKPLRRKDQDVLALICTGMYELCHLRTPAHAVVSETVGDTQALKKPWAKGLVNGVLRAHQRRDSDKTEVSNSARYALPQWLFNSLAQQYPERFEQIAAAARSKPPMALRINRQQTGRDDYAAMLAESGIGAESEGTCEDGLVLTTPVDIGALPYFAAGWVSVQDIAAQFAVNLLSPAPDERILDACAAPGGKACHILEQQPQLAELVAMDISKSRQQRIHENRERLRLPMTLLVGDASAPPESLQRESFDAILADVPCSATGVIRRNPDVKILRQAGDIILFADQQLSILRGLWPLLKPGGRLLYVTCSLLREENDDVINRFAGSQNVNVSSLTLPKGIATEHGWQTLPEPHGTDGLFFSLLEKPSE